MVQLSVKGEDMGTRAVTEEWLPNTRRRGDRGPDREKPLLLQCTHPSHPPPGRGRHISWACVRLFLRM